MREELSELGESYSVVGEVESRVDVSKEDIADNPAVIDSQRRKRGLRNGTKTYAGRVEVEETIAPTQVGDPA